MVESSWRTLAEVTKRELPTARRAELHARFSALRPAIESGWEMVVLLGVLSEKPAADDASLRDGRHWAEVRDAYLKAHALTHTRIATAFDAVRVRWMEKDARGWLERHRFYEGIAAWLTRRSPGVPRRAASRSGCGGCPGLPPGRGAGRGA